MIKSYQIQKSFTLIELLVVASIIIILSAIILINWRPGEQQLLLQRAAFKLAQDIRRASEMAMSTKEFQGKVPAGYGVYLKQNDNYYLLYADTNPAEGGNEKYDSGDDIIETIYFEKGVYIKNISLSSLSINFRPPNPIVKIDSLTTSATIIITLESDPTKTKTIRVNNVGLIDVE